MDEKFCFACAKYRKMNVMEKVKRGKVWRWMCNDCQSLQSGVWFGKEKKGGKKMD
jgi:hypothetical protein